MGGNRRVAWGDPRHRVDARGFHRSIDRRPAFGGIPHGQASKVLIVFDGPSFDNLDLSRGLNHDMIESSLHPRIDRLAKRLLEVKQRLVDASHDGVGNSSSWNESLTEALSALDDIRDDTLLADRFVQMAGTILVALDQQGLVTFINTEGEAFLGFERGSLVGRNWFETCIPEDNRALVRSVFDRLVRRQDTFAELFENDINTQTGERRIISWQNALWHDESGQVIGTLSAGIDVTEQRRIEAQLRAVVNTAVDAIITINVEGVIESFNPAAEKMFQYAASEIVGKKINTLMPSPYRNEHDQYIRNYLHTGQAKIIGIGREALGMRKDGSVFPIELAVSEVQVEDTRLFTGVVRDITERNRLEREVLEISTEEQQRIGRDLHDGLGQELTGIAFLTDVFQKQLTRENRPEAEAAGEIVKLVNQAIDHTRALVRGLCPVDLAEDGFMTAMHQLAESIASVHGVACEFSFNKPVFIHDYNMATNLYYIAHEAANNAARHGKPTNIRIELHCNDSEAVLQIKDDGCGLPDREFRGDGRGLHIMSYRAQVIGGTLNVKSIQPHGTVVSCTFMPDGATLSSRMEP